MPERSATLPGAHDLEVERVVPGGAGLARVNGRVALVEGALPGDRVRAQLSSRSARLILGHVLEVSAPGAHRRPQAEVCPHASDGSCGGCDWPAARLASHRELKTSLVLDAFRRVGGLGQDDLPEPGWIGSPRSYRLRNRLHLGRDGRLGFYAPRSKEISDFVQCEIVSEPFLSRLPSIRAHLLSLGPAEGELSTLEDREGRVVLGELRLGPGQGGGADSAATKGPFDGFRLVAPDGRLLAEDGPGAVDLVAGGASFRVSVSSFFQGNRFLLDAFLDEIRTALGAARPFRTALDLYAGVGFLTRPLLEVVAAAGGQVVAVEVDESSSKDLSENLGRWRSEGLNGARAEKVSAEAFLHSGLRPEDSGPYDVVVADPPRAGLSPSARRGLSRLRTESLLMVSCDPPTLARDVAALHPDYAVRRLTLIDLFPGTHHVETVALLARRT